MKIKKIVAPTMSQAMEKVKKELGSDAVILNTKKVKKARLFNLLKTEYIEVLAAMDPEPFPEKRVRPDLTRHDEKISDMKRTIIPQKVAPLNMELPHPIERIKTSLIDQGLEIEHVDVCTQEMIKNWYLSDETMTYHDLLLVVKKHLVKHLTRHQFNQPTSSSHMITVVGPTGVGKTTTLAKLAGRSVLDEGKSVTFMTTDTFRISAIDQLKTYARILNIPLFVVYNHQDFNKVKKQLESYDIVFIDTAGRNYLDETYVKELKGLIQFNQHMTNYLVLSATAKYVDMKQIVHRFSTVPIHAFIFTKMDETLTYGAMISLLLHFKNVPSAYITNGQNVPDDLIQANPSHLVDEFLGGIDRDRSSRES
ncbi:AAA family ATPase [Terrilactibacillus laevilacticus]|uniref:AAA family ATPase n=1 Tax=Terrilactibacillus laevilacticus TaxID=1380157 RepID=UPI0011462F55|nr:flagellar biosynthesis protein FlhF [Terrilactibacillus laevilacticus]